MRRYIAWHKAKLGFATSKEVEGWIADQENPEDWSIVATDVSVQINVKAEQIRRDNYKRAIKGAVDAAVVKERHRIIKLLGLDLCLA